jgi:hypothetical protein
MILCLRDNPPPTPLEISVMLWFVLTCTVGFDEPPSGSQPLFNGRDLSGWHGRTEINPYEWAKLPESERQKKTADWTAEARRHWTVQNGELVNDGSGPYLTSDKSFGDLELWIDYRTVAKADSGVYLRGCPQVQIWDYTEAGGKWNLGADKGSGGLWNNSPGTPGKDPLVRADRPFGEWNRLRIKQLGERTWVWLNDKLVVNGARMENLWKRESALPRVGPIQLQTHGGEIRWRNLFVREIGSDEANGELARLAGAGFRDLTNGRDLTGWRGAVDNYEVIDGAVVCKAGKGGFLFTDERFADAVVRGEFRLPAGGNSGVALRYPGAGRASTDGLCEIQFLDDDHPKYAKLDARQFCGSAYGLAAAQRGYVRPVGEWNYFEIANRGQRVTVELNGTRILDADLAPFDKFMSTKARKGQGRTEGCLAICGHRDPVAIRRLQVKPL